jgi:CelD/BcsL family acetyltransferase involved in cellulose biosynthesis
MNNSELLHVKLISKIEECEQYYIDWEKILDLSNPKHIFSSFDWICGWWRAFGNNHELAIILVFQNKSLVGVAPLMIRQNIFVRKLEFIGFDLADYNNFIIKPGEESKIVQAIFKAIFQMHHRFDIVNLANLADNKEMISVIKEYLKDKRKYYFDSLKKYPVIYLNSNYDLYYRSLSWNLREQIRRKNKSLSKLGKIEYVVAKKDSEVHDFFNHFVSLCKDRAFVRKRYSIFLDKNIISFYKTLAEKIVRKGWLHLSALFVNKVLVSIHLGFTFNKRFYWYVPVYNEQFRKFAPGVVHLNFLIQQSFEQKQNIFDFLRGEEQYKYRWAQDQDLSYSFLIGEKTLKGRITMFILRFQERIARSRFPHLVALLRFYIWRCHE